MKLIILCYNFIFYSILITSIIFCGLFFNENAKYNEHMNKINTITDQWNRTIIKNIYNISNDTDHSIYLNISCDSMLYLAHGLKNHMIYSCIDRNETKTYELTIIISNRYMTPISFSPIYSRNVMINTTDDHSIEYYYIDRMDLLSSKPVYPNSERLLNYMLLMISFWMIFMILLFHRCFCRITRNNRLPIPRNELIEMKYMDSNNIRILDETKMIITDISNTEESECIICYEKFIIDGARCCRKCNQYYHIECIDKWIRSNGKNCPTCRETIISVL